MYCRTDGEQITLEMYHKVIKIKKAGKHCLPAFSFCTIQKLF
jgi:hypothetical protein